MEKYLHENSFIENHKLGDIFIGAYRGKINISINHLFSHIIEFSR